jgi:hypothetical protein
MTSSAAAAMEREEREMNEHILALADDIASVDLSRFERVTALSDEAWRKLRLQKKVMTVKLPPSLQTIEKRAFEKCSLLREVNFASLTSLKASGKQHSKTANCCRVN